MGLLRCEKQKVNKMEKYIVFKKSDLEEYLKNNNFSLIDEFTVDLFSIGKEIVKHKKKEASKPLNKTVKDCKFSIPGFNVLTHKIEK